MNIIDFIPYGKENAINSKRLSAITGFGNRKVREEVSKAREKETIINLQDGQGYFRPTKDDVVELRRYVNQENSRAKSLNATLNVARETLGGIEHG